MPAPSRRDRARGLYAAAIARGGRDHANIAESVRQGFENFWIAPALDAIERLVLLSVDDEIDDAEAAAAA